MKAKKILYPILIGMTLLALLVSAAPAQAHGSTTVGNYTLGIGFLVEPALVDQLNGLDLTVTNTASKQPVTGLEDTLQAELIFGASRKTLKIEPVEGAEGHYTTPVFPTATGDYTWHIFGKIENTPVDVQMTSSPNTFASVVPPSEVSFPGRAPSITGLLNELARARQTAIIALVVGAVGVLLGIVGVALAVTKGKGFGG